MNTLDDRTSQLADNLASVNARIRRAADAAGRPDVPALIVVTKFHPAADVTLLRGLGVADVGENRDQEAAAKAAAVADPALRWHFIGQLQGNKAKSVVQYAHSVHSVDRASLVAALGRAVAVQQDRDGRAPLECFIQVDLSQSGRSGGERGAGPGGRGGAAPSDVPALADAVADTPGLSLAGVMAVAPLGTDPAAAFALLARVSAALVAQHPGAAAISAGMSQDLEQAIAAGATHLRVGSDILGPRPAVL
ncbi:YggS family pyridoxal phosphate-dependent enzyme [Arthrobacter sp.]|jgi:pyridoxal phosphate enzyme (YggS family)|uniref:YggS family pyridoxal phosphate-dependent enzyme n=1 Tax=Arthrobacter sp. TaxID=1667 RepID=UPI00258D1B9A|nr:YggS family pyridoxal phosphate-dependent enzyme [Arthrobacter sp.]